MCIWISPCPARAINVRPNFTLSEFHMPSCWTSSLLVSLLNSEMCSQIHFSEPWGPSELYSSQGKIVIAGHHRGTVWVMSTGTLQSNNTALFHKHRQTHKCVAKDTHCHRGCWCSYSLDFTTSVQEQDLRNWAKMEIPVQIIWGVVISGDRLSWKAAGGGRSQQDIWFQLKSSFLRMPRGSSGPQIAPWISVCLEALGTTFWTLYPPITGSDGDGKW